MHYLRSIFRYYIQSNIHVAINSCALASVTGELFNMDVSNASIFVGCATFLAYNLIRFQKIKIASNRAEVSSWFLYHKKSLVVLSIISLLILLLKVTKIPLEVLLMLVLPIVALTVLYMIPFVNIKSKRFSLRSIPMLKIFIISVSWSGICVLFPIAVSENNAIGIREILFFLEQILFVFVLTIPFDIRDMVFDSKSLKTLPQIFNVTKVKLIGGGALLISLFIHYCLIFELDNYEYLIIALVLLLLLFFSQPKQSKYYSSFWVESLPLLYYLILSLKS